MPSLRVALAQINTTIGDFDGNVGKIIEYAGRAHGAGADIVSFPELTITGYPPEDLLLRPGFIRDNLIALDRAAAGCRGITAVIGFVDRDDSGIYNAAALVKHGAVAAVYRKQRLPNYGVFDEVRYFRCGSESPVFDVAGVPVGLNICEDIWYPGDPTAVQAAAGARVIININGSPYHMGKVHFREKMLGERARDYGVWVCYTNQVGGQDELVFDGGSMAIDPSGKVVGRAAMFEEELLICDVELPRGPGEKAGATSKLSIERRMALQLEDEAEVYAALVLGTRDYLRKTGFQKALVAVSGGIDSAVVATIAADALGAQNVVGVSMPSRYSSEGSIKDARELAENLDIELMIIPIEPAHAAYLEMLEPVFAAKGRPEPGLAEENVQSRIRGNIIMSLSNKLGCIVLTTGNKSEFATGYTTLYGDMSGGFAVIKDVPKTLVYRLAHYRNALGALPVIPESILTKPPSAELKPGQLDQDTLPPYEVLDPIIEAYVEQDRSVEEIVAMGFDEATVLAVARLVNISEYKRRQAPPGIKITPRAFGRDRRIPIASRYRGS